MSQEEFFAFVLMPFDQGFDDVYRLGIKETAKDLGILAERVDEQIYREGILDRIYRQIEIADIIIADMAGKNPNVFYEVGCAHAKGKLCFLLTAETDDIPFDLKHRRHIVYGHSITTLRQRLKEELEWAQNQVRSSRKSHIKVVVHSAGGELNEAYRTAEGNVDFTVDLTNESQTAALEIDALYFYSTQRWTLYQDEKQCPAIASDLTPFERRHFLTLPVRRLRRESWCQIRFAARSVLARGYRGEELKDSYRVTGRGLLRIVTSDGNWDSEVLVDALIQKIPF